MLDYFKPRRITLNDAEKIVHVSDQGPAVIVMTEMPGISPHMVRPASRCSEGKKPPDPGSLRTNTFNQ